MYTYDGSKKGDKVQNTPIMVQKEDLSIESMFKSTERRHLKDIKRGDTYRI